jgi:hypothetical protein
MGGERGDPPIQQLRPKSKESAHSHRPPSFASSARNGLRPSLSGRPQQTAHFRVEDSSGLVQAEGNVAVACTVFDQASSRHDMKADPRSSKSGSERPGICSVEVTTSTVPWRPCLPARARAFTPPYLPTTPAVARQRSVDRSMRRDGTTNLRRAPRGRTSIQQRSKGGAARTLHLHVPVRRGGSGGRIQLLRHGIRRLHRMCAPFLPPWSWAAGRGHSIDVDGRWP